MNFSDFVQTLKEKIDIIEVIGEYVRLRKTGTNFMGLCPFHAERSPSFSVSDKKQIYHCFGCSKGGDVIAFYQDIAQVSFNDAIKQLAQKFKISIPPELQKNFQTKGAPTNQASVNYEVYYKLNRFVTQFYHENLLAKTSESQEALDYLLKRGLSLETIKRNYVGLALNQWSALTDFLIAKKAPLEKAVELGLIKEKNTAGQYYDLFRHRIMFPIADSKGQIVAFGGRTLSATKEVGPKYLNSPESVIYKKGNHFFGLFQALKDIREQSSCIIVEGFMDCLALQQAGISNTVATLGTALTDQQIDLITKATKNIYVLFDGDKAGIDAQTRVMETFLNHNLMVRGYRLPENIDPDEFISKFGAEKLQENLKKASFLLDQKIIELTQTAGFDTDQQGKALEQILSWISKINSDTVRMLRLQEVSSLFSLDLTVLENKLDQLLSKKKVLGPSKPVVKFRVGDKPKLLNLVESHFVELLVVNPEFAREIKSTEALLFGFANAVIRDFVKKLINLFLTNQTAQQKDILELAGENKLLTGLVTKSFLNTEKNLVNKTDLKDLEKKLTLKGLEKKKDHFRVLIQKADAARNTEEFNKLMNEYNGFLKKLTEFRSI